MINGKTKEVEIVTNITDSSIQNYFYSKRYSIVSDFILIYSDLTVKAVYDDELPLQIYRCNRTMPFEAENDGTDKISILSHQIYVEIGQSCI